MSVPAMDSGGGGKSHTVPIVLALVVLPVAAGLIGLAFGAGPAEGEVFLELPDGDCVRKTEYMRYHHMDFLKEIRDEVLREGKRGTVGLDRCKDCHEYRGTFCNRCHEKVDLTPDCFGCHYYPISPDDDGTGGE